MKTPANIIKLTIALAAISVLAFSSAHGIDAKKSAAKTTAPAVPEAPVPPPKSVFEDLKTAVDPFYPNSQRTGFKAPTAGGKDATPVPSFPIEQLNVRSILLGKEKTAQINDKIVGEGDATTIKVGKGAATIHVIEIRQRSVIIRIDPNPEPKEIFLRASP